MNETINTEVTQEIDTTTVENNEPKQENTQVSGAVEGKLAEQVEASQENKDDKTEEDPSDALVLNEKWLREIAPDMCEDGIKLFMAAKFNKPQAKDIVDYINKFQDIEKSSNAKIEKKIFETFSEKNLEEIQTLLKEEYGDTAKDVWERNKYNFEFISALNKLNLLSQPKQFVKSNGNSKIVTKEYIEEEKKKLMSSPHYHNNDDPIEHDRIMKKLYDLTAKQLELAN